MASIEVEIAVSFLLMRLENQYGRSHGAAEESRPVSRIPESLDADKVLDGTWARDVVHSVKNEHKGAGYDFEVDFVGQGTEADLTALVRSQMGLPTEKLIYWKRTEVTA